MPTSDEIQHLARLFEVYAAEFDRASPLYAHLSRATAADDEMLALFARSPIDQRKPTLPLAAVHYLLLQGVVHPLRAYYADLGGSLPPDEAFPAFRDFVLAHRPLLEPLLAERATQTNEIRRSAQLLPGFAIISGEAAAPLSLIEIGASAGLNLLFDRYGYVYGDRLHAGDPNAPVQVDCELRGPLEPPVPAVMPSIARRVGVDINPLDVVDADDALWLRACVWPEQRDRAHLLARAIAAAQQDPPTLVKGDALETLPTLVSEVPSHEPLVIFHSVVLPYFSDEARAQLSSQIAALGRERDLWWLTSEGPRNVDLLADLPTEIEQHFNAARSSAMRGGSKADSFAVLGLVRYREGEMTRRHLARGGMQGHWLEWLDQG